jgi:hypothetical protein
MSVFVTGYSLTILISKFYKSSGIQIIRSCDRILLEVHPLFSMLLLIEDCSIQAETTLTPELHKKSPNKTFTSINRMLIHMEHNKKSKQNIYIHKQNVNTH